MRRIGVFGGTFDPVHIGHLILAEECLHVLGLEAVWFVPAGEPPHKPDLPLTAAVHRVAMLEIAIQGRPEFAIDRVDLDRDGPSYSADTLERLQAQHLDARFVFLMGADSLEELHTWRAPERILAVAHVAVVRRPGVEIDVDEAVERVPSLRGRLRIVDIPLIGISSRELRRRSGAGEPIAFQVPAAVEQYLRTHHLYR